MKIVVAMSGGVDSSVAAAVLKNQGHEVIGVTLRMKHPDPAFSSAQLCAAKSDEDAVLSVVKSLGIKHVFLDRFPEFRDRVLRPSAETYLAGRTPNPCCMCNEKLKFASLFEYADAVGAEMVATGHYARIENGRLRRGSDPAKDQTYFLYRLPLSMRRRLMFPVGELEKPEVRRLAAGLALATASRPDSQDACFQVPGESFGETLRRLFELPPQPGRFVYHGKTVGRHGGIHSYTLGQRKGLGVALGVPGYVSRLDATRGEVELETDNAKLLSDCFEVEDVVGEDFPERLLVQVRYRSRAVPATLTAGPGARWTVRLDEPLRAVTPGQAAVFYDAENLLGGGVIC